MIKQIKTIIIPALQETTIGLKRIVRVHNEEGNPMTKKQLSECISGVIESKMVSVGNSLGMTIAAPKIDSEPDLRIDYKPLEIKTSSGREWRGGEYSKRGSDYLMVNYDIIDGEFYWFVIHKYLEEEDWKSSKSKNYYATTISVDEILDGNLLVGDLQKKLKLTHPITKRV
jgi:hypothetical protein